MAARKGRDAPGESTRARSTRAPSLADDHDVSHGGVEWVQTDGHQLYNLVQKAIEESGDHFRLAFERPLPATRTTNTPQRPSDQGTMPPPDLPHLRIYRESIVLHPNFCAMVGGGVCPRSTIHSQSILARRSPSMRRLFVALLVAWLHLHRWTPKPRPPLTPPSPPVPTSVPVPARPTALSVSLPLARRTVCC